MNNFLAILLSLFMTTALIGQQINGNPVNTILLPIQLDDALKTENSTGVSFFNYPYSSEEVDIRDMKNRYPKLVVPDTIEILAPNLDNFNEVNVMMGVIDPNRGDKARLILWLVGNPNSESVTFFVDETLDRNFRNDNKPRIIKAGQGPKKVTVFPAGKKSYGLDLYLNVPKIKKEKAAKIIKPSRRERNKFKNEVVLGLHAGLGVASVNHAYESTITGYPAWYETTMSERNLGLSLDKYFSKFKIGITGTYQNLYQYASTFNLRTGDREILISPNGTRIVKENLQTDRNVDLHSSHRLKVGVNASPRIGVSRYFDIMPTVTIGKVFFLNEEYVANRFPESREVYEHRSDKYMEYGLEFEFTNGNNRAINLAFSFTNLDWSPDNFFENIQGKNLTKTYYTYNFLINYKIPLF